MKIYIHHHLGLGDHFVCNGLVNYVCKKVDEVVLAVFEHNVGTVKELYKDVNNITFDIVKKDSDVYISKERDKSKFMPIGFGKTNLSKWEKSFYEQYNIPYEFRYSKFKIEDTEEAQKLYTDVVNDEKYAFCVNNFSGGSVDIDFKTKLPKVFLTKKTNNLLDWSKVIRNASEIHTLDTAVFQLIKNMDLNTKKYFYVINDPSRTPYTFDEQDWEVVNDHNV